MPQPKGAIPWNKGKKLTQEHRASLRANHVGMTGKRHSNKTRLKMSLASRGRPKSASHVASLRRAMLAQYETGTRVAPFVKLRALNPNWNLGENNPRWIKDRTKLAMRQERNDSAYKAWRKSVRDRDRWKCKMTNGDCLGKVVAHHILPWSKFPELRYELNNGITLCRFHHPRKRDDEMKLSPYFQSLVNSNSN